MRLALKAPFNIKISNIKTKTKLRNAAQAFHALNIHENMCFMTVTLFTIEITTRFIECTTFPIESKASIVGISLRNNRMHIKYTTQELFEFQSIKSRKRCGVECYSGITINIMFKIRITINKTPFSNLFV